MSLTFDHHILNQFILESKWMSGGGGAKFEEILSKRSRVIAVTRMGQMDGQPQNIMTLTSMEAPALLSDIIELVFLR